MKGARLSFVDDLADDDSDGEIEQKKAVPTPPIKKIRQAPPPSYIFVNNADKDEEPPTTYDKDSLEKLKASQKFVVPKAVEPEVVLEETILAGEEAEKAMELAEEGTTSGAEHKESKAEIPIHERMALEAGRMAAKELLKGKDRERVYLSANLPSKASMDINGAHDPVWEDEIMRRGLIGSKSVKPEGFKPSSGIFSASAMQKPQEDDIDIKDIISNIQTMMAQSQHSIKANQRKVDELKLRVAMNEEKVGDARAAEDKARSQLDTIRKCKIFLSDVVFMLREKLPLMEDLRDEGFQLIQDMSEAKRVAWQYWQEERILLVREMEELIGIGSYDPIGVLAGHQCTPSIRIDHVGSRVETVSLQDGWEGAVSHIYTHSRWIEMEHWSQRLETILRKRKELVEDVADEMLSFTDILNHCAILRNTITSEEYVNSFMPLSILQIVEALVLHDLIGMWKPFTSEVVAPGLIWIQSLASYAEGGAALQDMRVGDDLLDEDILSQLILSTVLPWLEKGLLLLDWRCRSSCQHGLSVCNYFHTVIQSHGSRGNALAMRYRAQLSTVLVKQLVESIESLCFPVCVTTLVEEGESMGGLGAARRGWKGMGKAVMTFQVATLATILEHAHMFQEYIVDPSQREVVISMLWSAIRMAQGTMTKLLKSQDLKVSHYPLHLFCVSNCLICCVASF